MALKLKCFRPAVQIWRSTVSVYCSVVQTGVQRPGVKMLPNLHNDDSAQRCNAFMPLNVKVFANLRRLAVQTGVQQHRAKMLLTCTTRLALNIVSMIIFWGTWTYSIDQIGYEAMVKMDVVVDVQVKWLGTIPPIETIPCDAWVSWNDPARMERFHTLGTIPLCLE
ncbi:hypothetical protein DEO72_LG7g975 [Vigna unguiculata]|uniref:Uncharacterized protein n=1 Tax=Vigna unguiculata TaxID=3917 RepID=A0A4D6MGP8_VIGUN|nr:hypothetical protein DEO72_LG7g975 [Vigna unguiculata]